MDIYGTATPYLPQLLDFVMDRVRDLSNKDESFGMGYLLFSRTT